MKSTDSSFFLQSLIFHGDLLQTAKSRLIKYSFVGARKMKSLHFNRNEGESILRVAWTNYRMKMKNQWLNIGCTYMYSSSCWVYSFNYRRHSANRNSHSLKSHNSEALDSQGRRPFPVFRHFSLLPWAFRLICASSSSSSFSAASRCLLLSCSRFIFTRWHKREAKKKEGEKEEEGDKLLLPSAARG